MTTRRKAAGTYVKFLMYVAVVVLLNAAGAGLFFRVDLTENGVYSLSEESREAVSTLSDPLTIKVFFSRNLPAPYNSLERYLRDLLAEYAVAGNRYFNFEFYEIPDAQSEEAERNQETARNYGIYPVQIQNVDQDQVKFQKAYMGLVLIQGNAVEKIPAVTSSDGLEYQITGSIRKLNSKISALLNLKEPVDVLLFLSSSLDAVAPYMNLSGLAELPGLIEKGVDELNVESYGKLRFRRLDPSRDPDAAREADAYRVLKLNWNAFGSRSGAEIPAGKGYAGLVVRHGDRTEEIRLIRVTRIPIFGTQYQLMDVQEIEAALRAAVENVVRINEEIGVLVSHGCPEPGSGFALPGQEPAGEMNHLGKLLGESYSVRRVDLKKEPIPAGLSTLIIAGPREPFSAYELYQIDQFLMQGRSVLLFLDAFNEVMPQGADPRMMQRRQGPVFVPVNTGLEELLGHYGLALDSAYVLDENCYKQRIPQQFGGGERPIYFAPLIEKEGIDQGVAALENIKGLVMLKASPVTLDDAQLGAQSLSPLRLVSSSDRSWEMKGRIDLNPMFLRPPAEGAERGSHLLAVAVQGRFPSYFAGKPVPEKPAGETAGPESAADESGQGEGARPEVQSTGETVETGKPGHVLLVGTSEILKDNIIDPEGRGPNAQFVLNLIDLFNGREARAVMRSKAQRFNPLGDIKPETRTVIKAFNIAGLPILVVAAGLLVWFRRMARKRGIQGRFSQMERGAGA